jgi:hypothetical protein
MRCRASCSPTSSHTSFAHTASPSANLSRIESRSRTRHSAAKVQMFASTSSLGGGLEDMKLGNILLYEKGIARSTPARVRTGPAYITEQSTPTSVQAHPLGSAYSTPTIRSIMRKPLPISDSVQNRSEATPGTRVRIRHLNPKSVGCTTGGATTVPEGFH